MTNTFSPVYVIGRGLYNQDRLARIVWGERPPPLWEDISINERNRWKEDVDKVFRIMTGLGYAIPDAKDKRK